MFAGTGPDHHLLDPLCQRPLPRSFGPARSAVRRPPGGISWVFVFELGSFFAIRAGARPHLANTEILQGARETIAICLINIVSSIQTTLIFFFLLVLLRVLVRNRWVAASIFVLLFAVPKTLGSDYPVIDATVWLIIYGIAAVAVVRFGLIVLALAVLSADVLLNVPITLDF